MVVLPNNKKGALVLVGGTGRLGLAIAPGLVTAEGYTEFRALVRAESAPEKTKRLADAGWIVRVVDFKDPPALRQALQGTHTLIATVGGHERLALQKLLIDAAIDTGVHLFVPSQFGVDRRRWEAGHPILNMDLAVQEYAQARKLPTLIVSPGLFSDHMFQYLLDSNDNKMFLIDGGTAKISFTRRRDVGTVLAKALSDPRYADKGGHLCLQGETMPWKDAVTLFGTVTGRSLMYEELSLPDAQEEEFALRKQFVEQGDRSGLLRSILLHMFRVPAAGWEGLDQSAASETYGVDMEPLAATIQDVYLSKEV